MATGTLAAAGDGSWIAYAGGYSDMLAQKSAEGAAAARVDRPAPTRSPASESYQRTDRTRRLTFNEKHALTTLPDRIATLEGEVARLRATLADPDLYARDTAGFTKRTEALASAEQALGAAEERWLELEMLREELEN